MTSRQLLTWVFLLFTLIAGIQFLQYYIFYNSSYPFPYTANLVNSFGTFYTYLLSFPLVIFASKFAFSTHINSTKRIVVYVFFAALVSLLHLFVMHMLNWLQIYQWTENPFWGSYRFLLSKWLHFELMAFLLFTFVWRTLVFKKENGSMPKPEYWTQVKIKESGLVSFLSVDDIRWIEAYDNYIKVWVSDRFHLVRMPLKEIETKLDGGRFKRIHRSTIVALEEVVAIRQGNGQYEVLLKDQTTLKLSRSFKKSIENSIKV